jgi:YVTN family beta-propeller protein
MGGADEGGAMVRARSRARVRARVAIPPLSLVLPFLLPAAVVAQPAEDTAFVAKSATDTVVAFDLATGLPVGADLSLLPEGNYPYDATITPDGAEVWIPGASGDGVIVIDRATRAITHRIGLTGVAEYPVDVIFEECGTRAFVASRDHETVAIVDRAAYQVIDTVDLPGVIDAGKMAISRTRNTLYVVGWYDDFLVSIDLDTLQPSAVDIGTSLWDLAIAPDESKLYVADRGVDQVLVVDLDSLTVVDTVPVGDDPWGIDIAPDFSKVVVANEDSSSVTLFDPATLVPQTVALPAGADPRDVEISVDGTRAYVPSGDLVGDDAVYVLDVATGALLDTIEVGPGNTNVVAVRPQRSDCGLFADGFETGDASRWSLLVP